MLTVFRLLSLRYLVQRWDRSALIVLSIALSVATLVSTRILNQCLEAAASTTTTPLKVGDLSVTNDELGVDLAIAEDLRKGHIPGLESVQPIAVDRERALALDLRGRGDSAGDADRVVDGEPWEQRAYVRLAGGELLAVGRIGVEEPLRQADAARLGAQPRLVVGVAGHDELGRPAADVDHERPRRERPVTCHPVERELRLFLAGKETRGEGVAPLDLPEERLAVVGVPDGARADCEDAFGAE